MARRKSKTFFGNHRRNFRKCFVRSWQTDQRLQPKTAEIVDELREQNKPAAERIRDAPDKKSPEKQNTVEAAKKCNAFEKRVALRMEVVLKPDDEWFLKSHANCFNLPPMKKQLLILLLVPAFAFAATSGGILVQKTTDPSLIGTWSSDCLTPDPKSPWSESHTFVFRPDNTATHRRISFDKPGCQGGENMNVVDNYRYTTNKSEGGGLIDLEGSKGTIYDMYVVMGNILMMGHGFRNRQGYGGSAGRGGSPATRISSINQYIVYKKLSK